MVNKKAKFTENQAQVLAMVQVQGLTYTVEVADSVQRGTITRLRNAGVILPEFDCVTPEASDWLEENGYIWYNEDGGWFEYGRKPEAQSSVVSPIGDNALEAQPAAVPDDILAGDMAEPIAIADTPLTEDKIVYHGRLDVLKGMRQLAESLGFVAILDSANQIRIERIEYSDYHVTNFAQAMIETLQGRYPYASGTNFMSKVEFKYSKNDTNLYIYYEPVCESPKPPVGYTDNYYGKTTVREDMQTAELARLRAENQRMQDLLNDAAKAFASLDANSQVVLGEGGVFHNDEADRRIVWNGDILALARIFDQWTESE